MFARLILTIVLFLPATTFAEELPNIVFLMADDQCTYSLGCYGTPDVQTPDLNALSAAGVTFDNHYDTTAICMASRATVMTGMVEYKTGCNFDHGPMLRSFWQQSYPILLREAGYRTAFAGKFGFLVVDEPDSTPHLPDEDFDKWGGGPGQTHYQTSQNKSMKEYADEYPHSTLSYGAFGRDFIRETARTGHPFCLSISFKAPHRPVSPDPKFDEVYAGKSFTKPKNFGREHGEHFPEQSRQGRQYERFHSWNYSSDYDGVMAKYHQLIYAIDVAVGMIRDALQEAGVADNTVVIYTSDNGYFCGSHGYGSKVLPYEESSRVPLIMFDPRQDPSRAGKRCQALTGNVDFAPTILSLAGLPVPQQMDGKNLMPLYHGKTDEIHDSLPLMNVWGPEEVHSFGVVTNEWKYLFWPYENDRMKPAEELYHLAEDPLELTNEVDNLRSRLHLRKMRQEYDRWLTHWKDEGVEHHGYPNCQKKFVREDSTDSLND